jgi:hypothetical protein
MVIDCDACAARGPACADCVVSVLLGGPPARGHEHPARGPGGSPPGPLEPVELDGAEQAALAVLAGCGLVPPLRLVPFGEPHAQGTTPAPKPDREVS